MMPVANAYPLSALIGDLGRQACKLHYAKFDANDQRHPRIDALAGSWED